MITLQKSQDAGVLSLATTGEPAGSLLSKEWLLTNERGSYSSSSVVGCNTRGYHGLLIGSLNPPVNRVMALSGCRETVIVNGQIHDLSVVEFPDKFSRQGLNYIKQFSQDIGVHFEYRIGKIKMTKSVYLARRSDTVAVVYKFGKFKETVDLVVRPFVGLRDFHTLQRAYAQLISQSADDGLLLRHDVEGSCELFMRCPQAEFERDEQWWFNFFYRVDEERGQPCLEDLWTPGFYQVRAGSGEEIVFWGNFDWHCNPEETGSFDLEQLHKELREHRDYVFKCAKSRDQEYRKLCLAADKFVVRRAVGGRPRHTILAGYPWFADWGRDAFIALPGLLLDTGRHEEARSVLTTFAAAADQGMIPNRFDDRSETVYFNSIDASLWFIDAAYAYVEATGDSRTFMRELLPVVRWIIECYADGTRFGIHADEDGLITGGNDDTQLTWMDAKTGGVAFTPRSGKAVEINALWYNALMLTAGFYGTRSLENSRSYKARAEQVAHSFRRVFWNAESSCLYDCIKLDGTPDPSLRPNQIIAVSQSFSPLNADQQRSVVKTIEERLLTPYGLRTLDPENINYKGHYSGPLIERDAAYHQGTVWPWLMGPFVRAYLKVNGYSSQSKKAAAKMTESLMRHMTGEQCLGSVCEIADAESPHRPKGCFAQAWSVAALVNIHRLLTG